MSKMLFVYTAGFMPEILLISKHYQKSKIFEDSQKINVFLSMLKNPSMPYAFGAGFLTE